jgi:hypothetical protein
MVEAPQSHGKSDGAGGQQVIRDPPSSGRSGRQEEGRHGGGSHPRRGKDEEGSASRLEELDGHPQKLGGSARSGSEPVRQPSVGLGRRPGR